MITDLLTVDNGSESTAQRLVSYLSDRGVDRTSIRDDHLNSLYAGLSRSAYTALGQGVQAPQFSAVPEQVADQVCGVIVETREHPALEYVVCQFSEQLNIGIQLFHSPANEAFVKRSRIAKLIKQRKVMLSCLDVTTFSQEQYNALLLSAGFWAGMMGRKKILVFQTDALLCAQSDYQLADFLAFDYIGSKWTRERPVGIVIDGGNGGLSLRDWQKSVECLERFSPTLWPGGEDGYFAFHIDLIGGKVGSSDDCSRFSTQEEFLYRSFGAHKVDGLSASSAKKFAKYCPEVANVL